MFIEGEHRLRRFRIEHDVAVVRAAKELRLRWPEVRATVFWLRQATARP